MMSSEHADETVRAVEVTHSPATVSSILAVVAAVLAVIASATSLLAMAVSAFGLVGVVAGLFAFESERAAAIGTGIVFVGVVLSGVFGNSLALLVLGALATVLSFDYGQNAFSVGSQLSDQTDTIKKSSTPRRASWSASSSSASPTACTRPPSTGCPTARSRSCCSAGCS